MKIKVSIMEHFGKANFTDMVYSIGQMVLSIEDSMLMASVKEMDNFLIQRIPASPKEYGKEVF